MVGRDLEHRFPPHEPTIGEEVLRIEDWTVHSPTQPDRVVVAGAEPHPAPRRDRRPGRADGRRPHRAGDERVRPLLRHRHLRAASQGRQGDRGAHRSATRSGTASRTPPRTASATGSTSSRTSSATSRPRRLDKLARRGWVDDNEEYRVAEGFRASMNIKAPSVASHHRQAQRRQPAEGRAVEVDLHRPGRAHPRRADPRHRRRRQVRDLHDHQPARRRGQGGPGHLLRAARAAGHLRPDLRPVGRTDHRRGRPGRTPPRSASCST